MRNNKIVTAMACAAASMLAGLLAWAEREHRCATLTSLWRFRSDPGLWANDPDGGRARWADEGKATLRLRVCGLGVGDGLVGGLDLLVGGFNLRVGNGLGFERGLLGLLGLGLGRLGVGQAGFGLRLVRVGLLDRGFRIRLVPGGGLGQLVGGIDLRLRGVDRRVRLVHRRLGGGLGGGGGSNAGGDGQGDPGKTPDTSKPAASPKPAGTADDGQAAGAAPLASTGAGTGPAIAVAGLLAMAGASLLAAVARTRRHGADPDGLTAD